MDHEEKKTEQFLKNTISRISAPRELFEDTLKSVTSEREYRKVGETKGEMANIPSDYYKVTSSYFFMKKSTSIGISIAVLALIVIVGVTRSNPHPKLPYNSVQTENFTKDSSVDSIVASFNADADTDATLASSESEDDQALQGDLQDYNDISTYSYENTI